MANLNFDQVAANQNQKEVTINDAFAQVDSALTETLAVDLSAGGVTITTSQWTRNWFIVCSGHAVARTVTIPAMKRPAVVKNAGTAAVTLQVFGGGSVVVQPGQTVMVYNDGVNLTAVGGGASAFTGLTDTFASYAGKANKAVRVNAAGNGLDVDSYWDYPSLADFDVYDLSGLSSAIQSHDGVVLSTPNNGARNLNAFYNKALPAQWVFEVELQLSILAGNYQGVYVGMGAVSDQSVFGVGITNNSGFYRTKLTGGITSGVTAASLAAGATSYIGTTRAYEGGPYVMRVTYAGGNFKFDLSIDGGNTYRAVYSVAASTVYPTAVPNDLRPVIWESNSSANQVTALVRKYRLQAA